MQCKKNNTTQCSKTSSISDGGQLMLNDKPVQITPGNSVIYDNISITAPSTTRVKLSFLMRTDESSEGFSHGVNIYVNDTMLVAAENRHLRRLLNKPLNFPYKQWKGVTYDTRRWYRPKTGWVMMDNDNWESSEDQCWLNDPQWSRYVLAIDDLIYSDRANTIKFSNDHGSKGSDKNILIDNITICLDEKEAGFGQATASGPFPDRSPRRTAKFTKPSASVDPHNGGLVVKLGKDTYRIESLFSYPNGGYNLLGPGPSPEAGEQAFAKSLAVTRIDDDTWTATAAGKYYSLKRCVKLFDNAKIQIKDQITNTSGADLGLIVKHCLRFDGRIIPHVFMSGDSDPAANNVAKRANPSLYVPLDNGGMGLLAEDDFFRMQMQCFYQEDDLGGTGIKTERLTIPTGQSYCMEWSAYAYQDPDGRGNYFDFVNLVRNDWGTNFRLDGPYIHSESTALLETDDATIAKVAADYGTFACVLMSSFIDPKDNESRSWFTHFYYGKKGDIFDRWLDKMDAAVAKMRKVVPNVKLLHKYESILNILDDIDKFPDSQVRDHNNQLLPYPPYREPVFPTLSNSYGREMTKMLEFLIDQCKFEGIFWDEFGGVGVGDSWLVPFATFYIDGKEAWDNHTGVIDPQTKQIVLKAAIVNTLSDAWTKKALAYLDRAKAMVIGNGAPVTRDYTNMHFPRFMEANVDAGVTVEGNLHSPLAYTSKTPMTMAVARARLELGGLPYRVPHDVTIPFMTKFFPITPIELHRGWILGKERLITAYSGSYCWDRTVDGTLYTYNSDGQLENQTHSEISASGTTITVPKNGLAVFVIDQD